MKKFPLSEHKEEVEQLIRYIPWLESKIGERVSSIYNGGEMSKTTISFPVYDSTLLSFVNEASKTGLMDENYAYIYSEMRLRTVEDEKELIARVTVPEAAALCAILSKYVLVGMTKGAVWTIGVTEGIYLDILKKMKELLEIWDAPLA